MSSRKHFRPSSFQSKKKENSYKFTENELISIKESLDHIFVINHYRAFGFCKFCKKIFITKCSNCKASPCDSKFQSLAGTSFKDTCYNLQGKSPSPSKPLSSVSKTGDFCFAGGIATIKDKNFLPLDIFNQSSKNKNEEEEIEEEEEEEEEKEKKNEKEKEEEEEGEEEQEKEEVEVEVRVSQSKDEEKKRELRKSHERTFKKTFKSQEKYVICTHREERNKYWVIDEKNVRKFNEIQSNLAKNVLKFGDIPARNNFITACFTENKWFRGKVIKTNPKVLIHLMDTGRTCEFSNMMVKKLPMIMRDIPGLARLIEFEQDSLPKDYFDQNLVSAKLKIEEINTANGIVFAKIIDQSLKETKIADESESEKNPISSKINKIENSIMDSLAINMSGLIFMDPGKDNIRFGSIVPEGEENKDAFEAISALPDMNFYEVEGFEAEEGSYVLVPCNEQRGKVLFKLGLTYYVHLIDSGSIFNTDLVYPMPDELKTYIRLGVRVTLLEKELFNELDEFACVLFNITEQVEPGKWICSMKNKFDEKPLGKAILEKPLETVEQDAVYVPLKSDSLVQIPALYTLNEVFVSPIDLDITNYMKKMNFEMSSFATRAPSLKCLPAIHTLCCAKYSEDDCFYRGEVIEIEENKVKVLFVDFGNIQLTELKDIRALPDSLKIIPFLAVKVTLKNVPSMKLSEHGTTYLENFLHMGKIFILTFEDTIDNGVTLIEKENNVIVNDVLRKKSDVLGIDTSVTIFGMKSKEPIVFSPLPVNEKFDLYVLHVEEKDFKATYSFWATNASDQNFNYVITCLNPKITEFCSNTSAPYRPEPQEVCFAELDDGWSRALTLEVQDDNFTVFFLDHGSIKTVTPNSIRKINSEYLKNPIVAVKCTINDFQRFNENTAHQEKIYNYISNATVITGVEVSSLENHSCHVEIPYVESLIAKSPESVKTLK